jgi:hypothetical protein
MFRRNYSHRKDISRKFSVTYLWEIATRFLKRWNHSLDSQQKKRCYFVVLLGLSFFLFFCVRVNNLQLTKDLWHTDEYYTVSHALSSIYFGKNFFNSTQELGSLETARWFARIAYPYGLITMNRHLGNMWDRAGNRYAGYFYLKNNWKITAASGYPNLSDPNLKEFLFGIRKFYVLVVFLSFLPLLFYCYKKNFFILGTGLILYLGLDSVLQEMSISFLVEPAAIVMLNLMIAHFLFLIERNRTSHWDVLLAGFMAAAMLSAKISAIFFVPIPIVAFYLAKRDFSEFLGRIRLFAIVFLCSLALINCPAFLSATSLGNYIHAVTHPFWYYAGWIQDNDEIPKGAFHLFVLCKQMYSLLGPWLFILPALLLLALVKAGRREKIIILAWASPLVAVTVSLAAQGSYLSRNLMVFYVVLVLITFLSVEYVFSAMGPKLKTPFLRRMVIGALVLLWVIPFVSGKWNEIYMRPKTVFLQEVAKLIHSKKFSHVFVFGFGPEELEKVRGHEKFNYHDGVPRLRSKDFDSIMNVLKSELVEGKSEHILNPLLTVGDYNPLILVNRIGNNKQLTNYFLQQHFGRNYIFGDYFIFHKLTPDSNVLDLYKGPGT